MRRALHSRSVIVLVFALVTFAGSANATVISGAGQLFEDFSGFTSNTLFGWYTPINGTGVGGPSANLNGQNGNCYPSPMGGCTYLEVKDTGTQGSFVSAGTAWGTTPSPVNYSPWDGSQFHYYVADIKEGGANTVSIATTFGTIYFTGNNVRTSAACTTNCTFQAMTVYTNLNSGIITQKNTWYELGTLFTDTNFKVLNNTNTPAPGDSIVSRIQWLDLIASVTNISVDTSLQTANSSDVIAIDGFGFNPEPSTYLLMGGGLAGLLAVRKRFQRKQ